MNRVPNSIDNTVYCIKSIGQSLINRAEDIANDTKVRSIIIHAELKPDEIVTYNITKEYDADYYTETVDEIKSLKLDFWLDNERVYQTLKEIKKH